MLVERGPEAEFPAAELARVGQSAGVQRSVLAQVGRRAKPFETVFALVRFFAGVHPAKKERTLKNRAKKSKSCLVWQYQEKKC